MKAAAVAAELPQHDVTWERCYTQFADLSTLSDDTELQPAASGGGGVSSQYAAGFPGPAKAPSLSEAAGGGDQLAPLESDLGDAPAEITPAEQQDAEAAVVLKPKRSPNLPTEEERRAHEVSHVPYRSWCPACVAGRGRSDRHAVSTEAEEHTKPVVSMDYCYLCSEKKDESKATPILAL